MNTSHNPASVPWTAACATLAPPSMSSSRPKDRLKLWRDRTALLGLLGVAGTLAFGLRPVVIVVLLFVLVVPFEKLFPRHRQKLRRPHLGTDLAYALTIGPLGAIGLILGVVLAVISFAWVPGLVLRPFVTAMAPLPRAVVGFLLFDLMIYWTHRFGHEVPFLWRFHRVHHSAEHLDWVSGFRSHPFDGVILAPAFALSLAAGFTAKASGLLLVAQLTSGIFLHANVRWLLRPLHKLIATPEFHHWHHSNEPDAHCSNYSGFLPIWDVLFGTYFMPLGRRPQIYGVDGPTPRGIVRQIREPLRGLQNPVRLLRHPRFAMRHLRALLRRGIAQMIVSVRRPRRPRST
jgi:sterol desaturase/sphingolipid hydroxylase (fatty acid hydroxylase superfamily)